MKNKNYTPLFYLSFFIFQFFFSSSFAAAEIDPTFIIR